MLQEGAGLADDVTCVLRVNWIDKMASSVTRWSDVVTRRG